MFLLVKPLKTEILHRRALIVFYRLQSYKIYAKKPSAKPRKIVAEGESLKLVSYFI